MLNLMSAVLKQHPALKQGTVNQDFVKKLFNFLFALPSPTEKLLPKCKSTQARTACYDLLVDLVKGCLNNYESLHSLLLTQHVPGNAILSRIDIGM